MKKILGSKAFAVVCKVITVAVLIGLGLKVALYGIAIVWPSYDYDLKLSSPDGHYDLIVLRGDAAAFDDFSYHIYVFPHASAPKETPKGKSVWMMGIWRERKYLIYSGYSYPMFRWTTQHAVEIDLDDHYVEVSEFYPVKNLEPASTIHASLVIGKHDIRNTMP